MNDREWHSGPPPHVGWWNASSSRRTDVWRWWDGAVWSMFAFDTDSSELAVASAKKRAFYHEHIQWTDYWPENARVPRIDPRQNEFDMAPDTKRLKPTSHVDVGVDWRTQALVFLGLWELTLLFVAYIYWSR